MQEIINYLQNWVDAAVVLGVLGFILFLVYEWAKNYIATPEDTSFLSGFRNGLHSLIVRVSAVGVLLYTAADKALDWAGNTLHVPGLTDAIHNAVPANIWPWLTVGILILVNRAANAIGK